MMRALLLAPLLLIAACDDAEVAGKALDVLEHGIVEAEVRCSSSYTYSCAGSPASYTYVAHKLIDGSSIVRAHMVEHQGVAFWARSDAESSEFLVQTGDQGYQVSATEFSIVAGELVVQGLYGGCGGPPSPVALDIETYCTGFNLEAFGVE
jgi:hypothetical protein